MPTPSSHPLRRAGIASFTALTLLAAPVHAAEPARASPEESARFEKARGLYTTDQYLPSASIFEELFATTNTAVYLYYAGLAREGAGHEAHAIRHWQQALKLGLDPEFTGKAQSRLTQAKSRTTALSATVKPAGLANTATLELTSTSGTRKPITLTLAELPVHLEPGNWTATLTTKHPAFEPETISLVITRGNSTLAREFAPKAIELPTTIEFAPKDAPLDGQFVLLLHDTENLVEDLRIPVTGNPLTVPLRRGGWQYTLEAPGQEAKTGTIQVAANGDPFVIPLRSGRNDSEAFLPKSARRKVALGLGISALAPAVAGATLTGLSFSRLKDAEVAGMTSDMVYYNEYDLKKINDFAGSGSLLIGGAAGLLIGTVVATRPVKRRAWYGLLGGGFAVAVAGFAWNAATYKSRDAEFSDKGDGHTVLAADWPSHRFHLMTSTAILGIGVGLALSSVTALVTARASRNQRSRAHVGTSPIRPGIVIHF